MRILTIDPFHGAAGDMFLGALLHLGADQDSVFRVMAQVVALPSYEMVTRAGIRAGKIHTHAGPASRTLEEVLCRIRGVDAPKSVIEKAEAVFHRIACAEEIIHGRMDHFHEVGADDAIADVLGSCMAMHTISPDRVDVLPVATGSGTMQMTHGIYPVPAPATAAILAESRLVVNLGGGPGELCTPTGAALLAEFCTDPVMNPSPGRIEAIGYGAGDREDPHSPNVLRILLLNSSDNTPGDMVDILETNVDDVPGEVIGYLLERLMDAGARDACSVPLLMKKGRPGQLVRVISRPVDTPMLAALMANELGTLGVRCIPSIHRFIADRLIEEISVQVQGVTGIFPVKFGMMDGDCYTLKAEYESVCQFAEAHHLPVRIVMREVEEAAWKIHYKRDCRQ
ncbi:MAG: nickel pincer cofactor biosynthesis protein LarC [Methanobacteriota archaeon]